MRVLLRFLTYPPPPLPPRPYPPPASICCIHPQSPSPTHSTTPPPSFNNPLTPLTIHIPRTKTVPVRSAQATRRTGYSKQSYRYERQQETAVPVRPTQATEEVARPDFTDERLRVFKAQDELTKATTKQDLRAQKNPRSVQFWCPKC